MAKRERGLPSTRRSFVGIAASVLVLVAGLVVSPGASAAAKPAPKPTVKSVSPNSGKTAGGTRVTVTGTGFTHVSAVTFGSVHGKSITVRSATKLLVTAPAHSAGLIALRVVSNHGTSALVRQDHYTYVAPPAITALSPTSGRTAGGVRVTVAGKNFTHVRAVTFGSVHGKSITVRSATRLLVTAPAHSAGLIAVRVLTGYGTSAPVRADHYTYVAPPAITALTPKSGPAAGGTVVTVTGKNFIGVTKVEFGSTAGKSVKVNSRTTLHVTTPPRAAGLVNVRIITKYGTSSVVAGDHYKFTGWAPAGFPVPSDAATPDPQVFVSQIACWGAGLCAGAGGYLTKSGDQDGALWRLSSGRWSVVKAPLPANAADNPQPDSTAISCGTAGVCAAAGTYTAHIGGLNSLDKNLMWTLSGGTWTAQNLPLPADAVNGFVNIDAVSCGGTQCAAMGSYQTADDNGAALWTRTGAAWTATEAPVPSDAATESFTEIGTLACAASGTCAATGTYSNGATTRGALWALIGGVWTVSHAALPADAAGVQLTQPTTLQMSCGATGQCAGTLQITLAQNAQRTAMWTLTNGVWSLANLPLTADTDDTFQPTVDAVFCGAGGRCAAAGRYLDSAGNAQAVLWSLTNGVWSAAKAKLPPDAAQNPQTRVLGLSCMGSGACVAAGRYEYHENGSDGVQTGLLWTYSGGAWSLVKPFAGTPLNQFVGAVSCGADVCAALGSQFSSGQDVAVLWSLTAGTWRTTRPPLPAGAMPGNPQLDGLTCAPAGGCVAWGRYDDKNFNVQHVSWVYIE